MALSASIHHGAHPAPHRHRVTLTGQIAALVAPPLVWSIHLVASYAFASRACFPEDAPLTVPTFGSLWLLLVAIDLASLVISAAAAIMAWLAWRISAVEHADASSPLVETGEGRTRFLAVWGILSGVGFFVAVMFDLIGLWILPIC